MIFHAVAIAFLAAGARPSPLGGPSDDAETAGLSLRLIPAKSNVFVGEPDKLTLQWSTKQPLMIDRLGVNLYLDAGEGFKEYRDCERRNQPYQFGETLQPGSALWSTYTLGAHQVRQGSASNAGFEFALPRAGKYRVKAAYTFIGGRPPIESNTVTIEAQWPEGREKDLFFKYLQARPEFTTTCNASLAADDGERVEKLLRDYAHSLYLARTRLWSWQREDGAVARRVFAGRSPMDRTPLQASEAQGLLQEIDSADFNGSAFDDERLVLAAQLRDKWGDHQGTLRIYNELIAKYPESEAAEHAREWVARELAKENRESKESPE